MYEVLPIPVNNERYSPDFRERIKNKILETLFLGAPCELGQKHKTYLRQLAATSDNWKQCLDTENLYGIDQNAFVETNKWLFDTIIEIVIDSHTKVRVFCHEHYSTKACLRTLCTGTASVLCSDSRGYQDCKSTFFTITSDFKELPNNVTALLKSSITPSSDRSKHDRNYQELTRDLVESIKLFSNYTPIELNFVTKELSFASCKSFANFLNKKQTQKVNSLTIFKHINYPPMHIIQCSQSCIACKVEVFASLEDNGFQIKISAPRILTLSGKAIIAQSVVADVFVENTTRTQQELQDLKSFVLNELSAQLDP